MKLIACSLALVAAGLAGTSAWSQDDEPEVWARLPEAVTNNAVAGVELDGHMMAYSFAGLHAGKTWRDVTSDAYACDLDARECREIAGLPDGIGRLASVAVTVRDQIYIFGGYTVAEDGSEASTPEVWRFDPASEIYTHITDMPVPVDDTVAMAFQDRYIYLVSGWHDTDNVDLVQVYDVEDDRWFEATPFPGAPVFGHAGALIEGDSTGDRLVVCGGTAVIPPVDVAARRSFEAIPACWVGQIDPQNPSEINWNEFGNLPSGPLYRPALVSINDSQLVLIGGSNNAYNYNGIGYNEIPSEPGLSLWKLSRTFCESYRFRWQNASSDTHDPSMDLRGAALFHNVIYVLGGMRAGQTVSRRVEAISVIDGETDPSTQLQNCGGTRIRRGPNHYNSLPYSIPD
jgi:hypothetical protein